MGGSARGHGDASVGQDPQRAGTPGCSALGLTFPVEELGSSGVEEHETGDMGCTHNQMVAKWGSGARLRLGRAGERDQHVHNFPHRQLSVTGNNSWL